VIFAGSGALAIAVIPVSLQLRGGPGELEVAFLDVGQGDAILVTTPHGQQVLIDGGPSGSRVVAQLAEVMPHWDRSLQQVVSTHPQEDHIGGLAEVAARFEVGEFSGNGFRSSSLSYTALAEEASEVTTLSRGDSFERDGVRFEVLWPPADLDPETDLNDTSLVVRVTYGQTSILLMGDSEGPVHEALVEEESLAADVLKVPHHGSKTTPAWLFAEVNPAVAVISVGSGNIYGHPHPDTLEALGSAPIFRTDLDGRIVIRSDGSEISVSTER
jgi:competence protein ComEC